MADQSALTVARAVEELRDLRGIEPRNRLRTEGAICILWGVIALAWFFSHHAIGASFEVFDSFALLLVLVAWAGLGTLVTHYLWQASVASPGPSLLRSTLRAGALVGLVILLGLGVSIGIHEILEPTEPFWLADFFPPLMLILIVGLATSVVGWTGVLNVSIDVRRVLQDAGVATIVLSLAWAVVWNQLRHGFDEHLRWVGSHYQPGREYLDWNADVFLQSLPGALALAIALILGGIKLARKG
jgi:hypothetical protein